MDAFFDIHTHRFGNPHSVVNVAPNDVANVIKSERKQRLSLGIHPLFAENTEGQLAEMKKWIFHPQIVAVGEIGIDKRAGDVAAQTELFEAQMRLAAEAGKPAVIHCVRATAEVLAVLRKFACVPAVFHGFRGKAALAGQILRAGAYISFGAKAALAPESVRAVPTERLFAETDDAPDEIAEIYSQIAETKNVSIHFLQKRINENAQRFFGENAPIFTA